ncbi:MAG: redox-regulated ATPase YchF [bacterium]
MNLSIGIVGLPNVGKSTLFNALTKQQVTAANYPFATIDPNVGIVSVPDERLMKLAAMSVSKKTVPAIVEFYDIAGLVKGANQGEGLGNQFLSHIREVSAIAHVIRCFQSDNIIHVEQSVHPIRDMEIIHTELILKDLETVERRLDKLSREARTGDKQKIKDCEAVTAVKEWLGSGKLLSMMEGEICEMPAVKELCLLTAKKQLYVLNGNESDVSDELRIAVRETGGDYIVLDFNNELDLGSLIRRAYALLGLISFFTTGEDETRAWTIVSESKAPQAAGVIHTDFERKFIRAEVIHTDKLLEIGSWSVARQKGAIRLEGKEYIVQDGDVMVIRHG